MRMLRHVIVFPALLVSIAGVTSCQPRRVNQQSGVAEFVKIDSAGVSTSDLKLLGALQAAKLKPDQVRIVAQLNKEASPDWADNVKRFLQITFTALTLEQCNSLHEYYGSWSKAKSQVKCEAGKSYGLTDFLPPSIQALNETRFAQQWQNVNLFDIANYPETIYVADRLQTQTNCWTTAYTIMRQAQTAENRVHAFFVGNMIASILDNDEYSAKIKEFPVESAPSYAERNAGLKVGDMLTIYGSAAVTNGRHEIMHAAIYLGDDLFFEKIAWNSAVPARFVSFSDIVPSYTGRTAKMAFRRFQKIIPDPFDVFSVASMWGKGREFPRVMKEIVVERPTADEVLGSFAYTITGIPLVYGADGRAKLSPSASDKATFEKISTGKPSPFDDIDMQYTATEIREAAMRGLIDSPLNKKFNPDDPITREQMTSLLVSLLKRTKGLSIDVPTMVSTAPFSDVPANRWSAPNISFAKKQGLVSGKGGDRFNPQDNVTRAETIVMLANTVKFAKKSLGLSEEITPRVPEAMIATSARDYQSHWAAKTILDMSRYCEASMSAPRSRAPMFKPDAAETRGMAVAAAIRVYHCLHMDLLDKK